MLPLWLLTASLSVSSPPFTDENAECLCQQGLELVRAGRIWYQHFTSEGPYVFALSEITEAETVHSVERGLRDSGGWWNSFGERDLQKFLPWISNLSTSEKGDSRHSGSHGSAFRGQQVQIKWEMDLSYFFIKMMIIIIKIDIYKICIL